jgi:ABC-2 type transport system permease protein
MIRHYFALVKREIWEHRSIYVTPIAIAVVVTLGVLAGLALVSGFAKELNMAIFGAQNIAGDVERKVALTGFFLSTSWIFLMALGVLTIFYCLDSLYAERKDKSILFWRSLPVTDAETVISKLLTALLVIPLVAIAAIIATHLVNLVVISIWLSGKGGDAGLMIWGSVPLLDNWLGALIVILCGAIWMSPFAGWFLFVSAFTKRSPLLMAFMPLVVIPLLEGILLRSSVFAETVLGRGGIPLFHSMDFEAVFDEEEWRVTEDVGSLLTHIDLATFFSTPSLWAGIVVCGLFVTAAIYVRRYRGES